MLLAVKWMGPEIILLSETSQTHKTPHFHPVLLQVAHEDTDA